MSAQRYAYICGTGMHVPPKVVTNFDLEKLMDTSDEWIKQRSGIEQRRHVDNGDGPADLALIATQNALENAGMKATELDMIIFATLSPDYYFPGSGVMLQHKLGLSMTPALDVRCQCTGFVYALSVARSFIESGQYQRILVVGAEVQSTVVEFSTFGRDVSVLFGDGAGAVIVGASPDESRRILSIHLHADGAFADKLCMKKPGCKGDTFVSQGLIDEHLTIPFMDGRHVFKHAVTRLREVVDEALTHNHATIADVDLFLFHQANLRINESVANTMGISPEKAPSNIQKYGNCSGAAIPILMHEMVTAGRIKPGDLLCMAAFGSGFTWGSAMVRF